MELLSNLPSSSSPLLHAPSSSPSPKSRVRVSQNLLPIRRKPSQYFPISSQNRRRMEAPTTIRCSCQAGDNGSPTGTRIFFSKAQSLSSLILIRYTTQISKVFLFFIFYCQDVESERSRGLRKKQMWKWDWTWMEQELQTAAREFPS